MAGVKNRVNIGRIEPPSVMNCVLDLVRVLYSITRDVEKVGGIFSQVGGTSHFWYSYRILK